MDSISVKGQQETNQTPKARTVGIHLIDTDDMRNCHFWIGVFHRGTKQTTELFNAPSLDKALEEAARDGLSEDGPIMLSNSSVSPAQFLLLMPEPGHDSHRRNEWIEELVETIKSWGPPAVGLYLAPTLVNQRLMQELINDTLKSAMQQTAVTDYYLQTATHGLNAVLNTTLHVKRDVGIEAFVFH